MLGLLLIYFIGKSFYNLAGKHDRSQWGFAIVGVLSYYAGTIITGLVLGIIDVIRGVEYFTSMDNLAIGLIAMPFGILSCWGLYKILKVSWKKDKVVVGGETLDAEIVEIEH